MSPDGPVGVDLPKRAYIEYSVAYTDSHPHTDGAHVSHMAVSPNIEVVKASLEYLKRHHPDARIQSRIVYPWQDVT